MNIGPQDAEPNRANTVPKLMTTSEIANVLRCSEKTILRRVQAGALPAIKEGGRYLFDAQVIRAALLALMVRPKSKTSTKFPPGGSHCNRPIQTDQEPKI
jgi:excisionase family DNA binding protein